MPVTVKLQPAEAIAHVQRSILPTPFYSRTSRLNLNQQWSEWNGFASAVYYGDAHLEYFSTRNTCGVFDASPMRKYRFSGADAAAMLDRMVTRDVVAQAVDTVAYNVWCTDAGRVVDDGTIFRLGTEEFMLCCADPCYDWFCHLLRTAQGDGFCRHRAVQAVPDHALSLRRRRDHDLPHRLHRRPRL
jgi:aminomethyltransferase